MPLKKYFIDKGIQQSLIEEFLGAELDNSGYAGCELQKTPMGTRITIRTSRPGIVIGRRGARVKELTEAVKNKFNINVPTIDVETVEVPELNAQIQAERIAFAIQKGQNYRRATYSIIRKIMKSGARGVEVKISGKVTSQRARNQVFRAGVISKCGTPATDGVDRGVTHLTLKSGVLGIRIKIMPLSYQMPDEVKILEGIFDREEKTVSKSLPQVDKFYTESEKPEEELPDELATEDELFDDTADADESIIVSEEPASEEETSEEKTTDEKTSEKKEKKKKGKKK